MGQTQSLDPTPQRSKAELLYLVASTGNAAAIRALVSQGASVEWTDDDGRSPLILACSRAGLFDAAKTLIQLGANVNAYRRGPLAGTPLHHACRQGFKPLVILLLSHRANAFIQNDDCQTPLDVARLNGHNNIVRALENHLCYFSGWVRKIYGPGILERLAPRLVTSRIWVVVIPCGPTNSMKPLQLELAIYSTKQDARPCTVISLWKAQIEKPDLRQSDPKIAILNDSTKSCLKLASEIQGDAQQLQSLYNACLGISQVMPSPVQRNSEISVENAVSTVASSESTQHAPAYIDQTPEASSSDWLDSRHDNGRDWLDSSGVAKHSDPNSSGWIDTPVKNNYNGFGVDESQPLRNPTNHTRPQSENAPTSPMSDNISVTFSSAPSAPPIPVERLAGKPICYPSINPISDVPTAAITKKASTSSNTRAEGSCVICWEAPVECALIPCGHMVGCMSCLNNIKAKNGVCPVCRSKTDRVVRLYAMSI